jgi:hypothetical protein
VIAEAAAMGAEEVEDQILKVLGKIFGCLNQ